MYVIPLIILIIVLIVVKKRQNTGSGSNQSAKKNLKKKIQRSSSSSFENSTQVVEDPFVEKKQTSPLPLDLQKSIKSLISDRNFFAAEAQINQALKKDNSLHELYLLLLEVHLLQKDDFAINQLLGHIRSLELNDIVIQAEEKLSQNEEEKNKKFETIAFTSATNQQISTENIQPQDLNVSNSVNHEFDALFEKSTQTTLTQSTDTTSSTPDIHTQEAEEKVPEIKKTIEEIQPIEFSFSFKNTETELKSQEVKQAPEAVESKQDTLFNLSENFTEQYTPVAEYKFTKTIENEESIPDQFEFTPSSITEITIEDSTEFNLDSVPEITPVTIQTDHQVIINDKTIEAEVEASKFDQNDPIIRSFPEISQIDEIELNFELAEKYIELGAYDAARHLLAEKETNYNDVQRNLANQILNKIASETI